ncbi:GNAT family N-acetyltransferase [Bacillus sp. DTU_2020_1000418_1_SI_GHA_SEK_038]|uniref:GNAT family N-acetyltransferase n=1 Tax=Bacillus sp. DTU_2020_1000418_1_SI_GHA_SEK_038 TaxID=3077585 RepID=UPI0028EB3480|nr:GNAT family N-acetyltransferase [Bacillus sp. DTU_2020_1000418_1_SI_GHA_SEK_038]WNS73557.1 GNAT family N-acetyltransferase [Bacillus sp. DTU_2020_1000418_1_SI_GHA_SEK_038]
MKYSIRIMTLDDIPQVQNVAKSSWNHTYEGIIPRDIQDNFLKSAYNYEMMKRRLEHSYLYVSEIDGKIVGFANFSPVKEHGEIELGAIYLLPEYQGKGIGTALLREGLHLIEGINEVYINVERDNHIGKNFYDAKGFTVVSEFDDNFDGHILKTVRMVLKKID